MFCLLVPHRLLQQWRKQTRSPRDYIPLLNQSIAGEAVVIKSDNDSVGARYTHMCISSILSINYRTVYFQCAL